jgi:uncharacterized membrane-anchored protein YhcB (DUF1043 family)
MTIYTIIGLIIGIPSLVVFTVAIKNHYQQQALDRKRLEMKRRKMDAWKKSRRAKRWQ